ncbi:hypothetical protein UFOVP233_46 [uncultured Caudovirales phage]|uniref:Uncharacterized protein n=1 Tax=uncultured Caudovirales phage TaxID=2100421 RepID=A0A6J7WU19_9CAUD|nr:hypothetical protein UFOVP233_46 [uncultured Caudovirales phage]
MDWIIGLTTWAAIIGGAFLYAYFANPFRSEIDQRRKMLRAASWSGTGQNACCDKCGSRLTVDTIGSVDDDGNGYCTLHAPKRPEGM